MTTVILVTIGILLAAMSALMMVWYGGDAFDQGTVNAEAARLLTEGAQIERAVGSYRAQEGSTPDARNPGDPIEALVDRKYLADRPPGDTGRWKVDYSAGMIRADMGATNDARAVAVCRAARRSQNLPNPNQVYRCDGSDYPMSHPVGTLPATEPCCVWAGAAAEAGTGRGTYGGTPGGGTPPPVVPTQPPAGASVQSEIDYLTYYGETLRSSLGRWTRMSSPKPEPTVDNLKRMGLFPKNLHFTPRGVIGSIRINQHWLMTRDVPLVQFVFAEPYDMSNKYSAFCGVWNQRNPGAQCDNWYYWHIYFR